MDLQANQSSYVCVVWSKQESERARNRGQHEQSADKRTAVVWHELVCQSTQPNPNHHQNTLRNAQQSCMQGIKIQSLDDQSRKVGNSAVWNVGHKTKQSEEPSLVVQVRLLDLLPVDLVLLYARLVASHAGNHDQLFVMAKAPDRSRRVGETEEEADSPSCAKSTDDDEFVAP